MSATTDTNTQSEMMKLCIEDDEGVRATYPLLHSEVRVGRGPDNEIQLFQRNISREHALFVADPEERNVFVQDLESYTGVKLNGKRISQRCILRENDFLQIGGYVITLELEGSDKKSDRAPDVALRSEIRILPPEHHARLVVVSNNLAGREFHLNRAEMIIGREPSENDLVINHRSISRNHAKIVWKNEEFTIIDLSSANGIVINGSTFAAARLIRGAIIQLGLVKLRYVAPGEEYHYNPADVDITALDSSSRSKQLLSLIVFAVTVFFAVRLLFKQPEVSLPSDQASQTAPATSVVDDSDLEDQIDPQQEEVGQTDQPESEEASEDEEEGLQPEEEPEETGDHIPPQPETSSSEGTSVVDEAPQDQSEARSTDVPAEQSGIRKDRQLKDQSVKSKAVKSEKTKGSKRSKTP